MPTASDVMFKATTSRSENLGTTPLLGTFPDSLTKLPAICLHMFKIFANDYPQCFPYCFSALRHFNVTVQRDACISLPKKNSTEKE